MALVEGARVVAKQQADLRSSSWSVDFLMPSSSCSADSAPLVWSPTRTVIKELWSFSLVTSNNLLMPICTILGTNSAYQSPLPSCHKSVDANSDRRYLENQ